MNTNITRGYLLHKAMGTQKPDDRYVGLIDVINTKGLLGNFGSLKERLARRTAMKLISILMRDVEIRRLICVTIATELRTAEKWMSVSANPPSPRKK